MSNKIRNAKILKLLEQRKLSYQVVADMVGVTRCVVAGVAFRSCHPRETLLVPPGYPPSTRVITGTGWQPPSYRPEKTVANTR